MSVCVCVRVKAEELMRKIEKEEEQISYDDPDKKIFHLCIVNLVIGYAQHNITLAFIFCNICMDIYRLSEHKVMFL